MWGVGRGESLGRRRQEEVFWEQGADNILSCNLGLDARKFLLCENSSSSTLTICVLACIHASAKSKQSHKMGPYLKLIIPLKSKMPTFQPPKTFRDGTMEMGAQLCPCVLPTCEEEQKEDLSTSTGQRCQSFPGMGVCSHIVHFCLRIWLFHGRECGEGRGAGRGEGFRWALV